MGSDDTSALFFSDMDDDMYPLSVDHRCRMYQEMSRILEKEEVQIFGDAQTSVKMPLDDRESPIVWKTVLVCAEISLQVNKEVRWKRKEGAGRGYGKPVARLACSPLFRQNGRADGSWDVTASIASFEVLDLTCRRGDGTLFPLLVGRKTYDREEAAPEETVLIQGVEHRLCICVDVTRKREYGGDLSEAEENADVCSTTFTTVRLLPLEVVYSTKPMAALSNIFLTVKTPELADDFHRMASVISKWQENQRKRLLLALANKKKKIIVDIDVAAPVLLIPEDVQKSNIPMLVIDLGRLQFCNADYIDSCSGEAYDDVWKLSLSRIQVLSAATSAYTAPTEERRIPHQIIEPFSLNFTISTSILTDNMIGAQGGETRLHISATLPRLVFNLTTSAVRLLLRLQQQWKHQTIEKSENEKGPIEAISSSFNVDAVNNQRAREEIRDIAVLQQARTIQFSFSAPLIGLKLENDVDGRDCIHVFSEQLFLDTSRGKTTLGHLVLRGIRGTFQQEVSARGALVGSFEAKIRSLIAKDLYQQAGVDFSLFLSSVSPDCNQAETFSLDNLEVPEPRHEVGESDVDLVYVRYLIRKRGLDDCQDDSEKDTLIISFNELFVEWNPETVAAIHKAMQLPYAVIESHKDSVLGGNSSIEESDDDCAIGREGSEDEFFDALEGHETESPLSLPNDEDSRSSALSEISSNGFLVDEDHFFIASAALDMGSPLSLASMWPHLTPGVSLQRGLSSGIRGVISPTVLLAQSRIGVKADAKEVLRTTEWRLFEVTFDLSKLRIRFNKEFRRRRLLIAEMDGTAVSFKTRKEGGSIVTARMGNLALSDPSAKANSTLYHEVVGLQSDNFSCSQGNRQSLLELTFISNPPSRDVESTPRFDIVDVQSDEENERSCVRVDATRGNVSGCDYFVSLQFSPMRFVYLQQFWFEVIDYFFEGIIGAQVWGDNTRPSALSSYEEHAETTEKRPSMAFSERASLPGADANGLKFTRFVIELETPIVLVPVTYRSPQFLRLEFDSLKVANNYNSAIEKSERVEGSGLQARVQWFNNCNVTLKNLRIKSWSGTVLSRPEVFSGADGSSSTKDAEVILSWPIGPGALLILPKWNVDCRIDDINIYLRRGDYALLQNIIMHNIGEPSRHLDEWIELQALQKSELARYKHQIMVHFGYDKKDAAPSTYSVEVRMPSVCFFLVDGPDEASEESVAAEARCISLLWVMKKLSDCITRQKVTCEIGITQPSIINGIQKTVHLILPSALDLARQYSTNEEVPTSEDRPVAPELVYTSTTRASGDTIKTLDIANACIHFVYPAWARVVSFFSDLAMPDIWTQEEVSMSMQIGDRWYKIGGRDSQLHPNEDAERGPVPAVLTSSVSSVGGSQSYQFHLRLVAPRVVLNSMGNANERVSVVLHMDNLDYLHDNQGASTITRSFFVHNLELFTSAIGKMKHDNCSQENSLINPWSAIGLYERCNRKEFQNCNLHRMTIHAEVLKARAAYSDLIRIIDVGLRLLSDLRSSAPREGRKGRVEEKPSTPNESFVCTPSVESIVVGFGGLDVLVVDDSMRHFAEAQELLELSLSRIRLMYERKITPDSLSVFSTRIQLASINLLDHLQPVASPFRLAATSRESNVEPDPSGGDINGRLKWADYCSNRNETWGVAVSEMLVKELRALADTLSRKMGDTRSPDSTCSIDFNSVVTKGVSRNFDGRVTSLIMQWNPSTVIALQRFMGRLAKEANQKAMSAFQERLQDLLSAQSEREQNFHTGEAGDYLNASIAPSEPIRASLRLESLKLCLNKEHQNRRLMEAAFINSSVELFIDADNGLLLQGAVEDVSAWDADNYDERDINMLDSNRNILRVARSAIAEPARSFTRKRPHFFHLEFKTYPSKVSSLSTAFPEWIQSLLASMNNESRQVDDYLSVSIATLEFVYLRERTEELLDYLSNGLPGKGMGATSRAATGFIKKRIQTRSFLSFLSIRPN